MTACPVQRSCMKFSGLISSVWNGSAVWTSGTWKSMIKTCFPKYWLDYNYWFIFYWCSINIIQCSPWLIDDRIAARGSSSWLGWHLSNPIVLMIAMGVDYINPMVTGPHVPILNWFNINDYKCGFISGEVPRFKHTKKICSSETRWIKPKEWRNSIRRSTWSAISTSNRMWWT